MASWQLHRMRARMSVCWLWLFLITRSMRRFWRVRHGEKFLACLCFVIVYCALVYQPMNGHPRARNTEAAIKIDSPYTESLNNGSKASPYNLTSDNYTVTRTLESKIHQASDVLMTKSLDIGGTLRPATPVGSNREARVARTNIPGWIEIFDMPSEEFTPQSIPIVVFSSFRHVYLKESITSLRRQQEDISPATLCTFVLHRTQIHKQEDVVRTLELIRNVTFCKVSIWNYTTSEKPSAKIYKLLWWNVVDRIFSLLKGFGYFGDVLFLEEDAVLSPDAIKVLWYCSRVKSTFGPDIWQVALGGHGGQNMVNPHPDTFNVRKTTYFQAMAYAFNRTFWDLIKAHPSSILGKNTWDDFSEALALFYAWPVLQKTLNVIAPTMGRMWHIGGIGLGLGGDYQQRRETEAKPTWSKTPRFIDLKSASVNDGIRDQFGILCPPSERTKWKTFPDNMCQKGGGSYGFDHNWYDVVCLKQPYVVDRCI